MTQIILKYGYARETIRKYLLSSGISIRSAKENAKYCPKAMKNQNIISDNISAMIHDYVAGLTVLDIRKKYNIKCHDTVVNALRSNGVIIRTHSETMKTPALRQKYQDTCLAKYGVSNISKLEETKAKVKAKNLMLYGNEYENVEKYEWVQYILGRASHPDKKLELKEFKKVVNHLTKLNKKYLEKSNACYYTGEFIFHGTDNHFEDDQHASVDHKVSVLKAFEMGWSPEQTADISNLCYCSRFVNSLKRQMTEEEFKQSGMIKRLKEYEDFKNRKNTTEI